MYSAYAILQIEGLEREIQELEGGEQEPEEVSLKTSIWSIL